MPLWVFLFEPYQLYNQCANYESRSTMVRANSDDLTQLKAAERRANGSALPPAEMSG
jgi:hypothetical protein